MRKRRFRIDETRLQSLRLGAVRALCGGRLFGREPPLPVQFGRQPVALEGERMPVPLRLGEILDKSAALGFGVSLLVTKPFKIVGQRSPAVRGLAERPFELLLAAGQIADLAPAGGEVGGEARALFGQSPPLGIACGANGVRFAPHIPERLVERRRPRGRSRRACPTRP